MALPDRPVAGYGMFRSARQFGILTLSPDHVNTFQHSGTHDEAGMKAALNIGISVIGRERYEI